MNCEMHTFLEIETYYTNNHQVYADFLIKII